MIVIVLGLHTEPLLPPSRSQELCLMHLLLGVGAAVCLPVLVVLHVYISCVLH